MLYALLVGRPPFETPDVRSTYQRIKAVSYTFPDDAALSPEARDLISRILRWGQCTSRCTLQLSQLVGAAWYVHTDSRAREHVVLPCATCTVLVQQWQAAVW